MMEIEERFGWEEMEADLYAQLSKVLESERGSVGGGRITLSWWRVNNAQLVEGE